MKSENKVNKRRISILLLSLLLLPCILLMTACSGNDSKNNEKHNITFIVDEEIYAKIETAGNEYIQLPTSPTKDGYTFVGWFFDNNTYKNELKANTYANTKLNSNVNVFAKFTYIENPILAGSISLDKTQLNMTIGETYSLLATILPNDATNKNITWSSSNQNVATVIDGKITAISVGQTTIKAQTSNNKFATCEVKVIDGSENVQVEVYIDNQKVNTLITNFAKSYKITAPTKPEDITVNPNSEKYFYGWFVDSNYQTPLTNDTVFTSNGKIYAKWINVYSNNFIYSVSKGKATITLFNNAQNLTVVVIPCYINSFPVETIGASSFINQTMLRNVIICNGIKTIEVGAFYGCNSMESISLSNTLETIESNAFENCEILKKISLPNSLHKIGANAFKNCTELNSVEFNNDGWWLTNNTDYVFEKSMNITNVNLNAQYLISTEVKKIWTNFKLYSINYHLDNGQLLSNAPHYFSEYTTVELVGAVKMGYTFYGYYLNNNFTSKKVEKIEKGTTSFEVYAKWNLITYKIEYNLNGGEVLGNNPITYNVEMGNLPLLKPQKDYYDFIGWYDGSALIKDINTQQCRNLSLTAKFTPTVYTVSYELNGGINSSVNPTTYTIETPTITLSPAQFENETVSRWYSEQTFGTRITTIPKGSHGNIKLYARAGYDDNEIFVIENNVLTGIKKAFVNEFKITKIIIPSNVINISSGVLNGYSTIEEITLPFVCRYFVSIFGRSSYQNSYYVNSLCDNGYIPESLKKVIITGGKSIGGYAFYGCRSLTSIKITNSVTSIGESAFSNCSSLTSISITNSVTSIGKSAFSNCSSLTSISIPNGVESIDFCTFEDCSGLTSIIIPNSVTSIGAGAFEDCSGLTSIIIPDSVTSIGRAAFSNCSSLTSISIPNGVESIDFYTFEDCSGLTSIIMPNSVTSIGGSAFSNCSSLTSISIPNSVTSIGESAFSNCYSLTSISIPNGVTCINKGTFYNCSGLTSITISDNVTSIDTTAFTNCEKIRCVFDNLIYIKTTTNNCYCLIGTINKTLTQADINENCKFIFDCAFSGCSDLTSIAIPNNVISIGTDAFYNCEEIKKVHISSLESWFNINFGNYFSNPLYYAHHLYLNGEELTEITILETITEIKNCVLNGASYITSITIPNSVTSIGDNAFYGCESLTSITIPDSVTSIGKSAFGRCSSLDFVAVGSGILCIGDFAFYDCDKLRKVYISSLETWFNIDFKNSSSNPLCYAGYLYLNGRVLTEVIIPNTINAIKNYALYNAVSIRSIVIPNSITSIGFQAFYNCSGLHSIIIPESVTSIGDNAFRNCFNLTIYCKATSIPTGWYPENFNSFYWYSETQPTKSGNYWHYVDGKVTIW